MLGSWSYRRTPPRPMPTSPNSARTNPSARRPRPGHCIRTDELSLEHERTQPQPAPADCETNPTATRASTATKWPQSSPEPKPSPNTLPPSLRSGSRPAAVPAPPSRRLSQDRYRPVNAALDTVAGPWRHSRLMVLCMHPTRPMPTHPPSDQTNPRARHSTRASQCRRLD